MNCKIAKSGYIEVPDAFMERLTDYPFHKLEITKKNNELLIFKKKNDIVDQDLIDLFRNKFRDILKSWVKKIHFNSMLDIFGVKKMEV